MNEWKDGKMDGWMDESSHQSINQSIIHSIRQTIINQSINVIFQEQAHNTEDRERERQKILVTAYVFYHFGYTHS